MAKPSQARELFDLDRQIGEFLEYWGFKRIHGRIWTHLYLSQEALGTAELMKRLKISKALMSLSIHEMLRFEVIRVASQAAHGAVLYEANPDLLSIVIGVLKQRELPLLERIETSFERFRALPSHERTAWGIGTDRQETLGQMISGARLLLEGIVTHASQSQGRALLASFLAASDPRRPKR